MKKWIGRMAVLLAFVLTLSGSTLAAFGKIPSATKEFYVNDYAGVFSDTWKEELCKDGIRKPSQEDSKAVLFDIDVYVKREVHQHTIECDADEGNAEKFPHFPFPDFQPIEIE